MWECSGRDVAAGNDSDDWERGDAKNVWCSGCWEELPDVCGCGSSRWCVECAAGFATVLAERGRGTADGTRNGVGTMAQEGMMARAVRDELQVMAQNFERMGSLIDDVGTMARELHNVRVEMVSRNDWQSLLNRIGRLDGGSLMEDAHSMAEEITFTTTQVILAMRTTILRRVSVKIEIRNGAF